MKLKIPSSWGNFDAETLSNWKQLRAIKRKRKKLATPMLLRGEKEPLDSL